jgi:hypothetical protein
VKWALLLATGVIAGLAWWWYTREDEHTVSSRWRDDQRRREMGAGLDGVKWRWPYRAREPWED